MLFYLMNFDLPNFCLILSLFIDFSWTEHIDHGYYIYKFNGSETDCDDSEIEKYFIPGQSENLETDTSWKEFVK